MTKRFILRKNSTNALNLVDITSAQNLFQTSLLTLFKAHEGDRRTL